MSTLALMRLLESAPSRYDRGMRWLTLGRVDAIREAMVAAVVARESQRPAILEIGCGTGALTAQLVVAGARVTALDQNPEMLELAVARLEERADHCVFLERTASEIDKLPAAGFDAVVASFSLSEMSLSERGYVLQHARGRLRPGGLLAIADEIRPRGRLARAVFTLLRAPQAAIAWIAVGSVSRPIPDLEREIAAAGFEILTTHRWLGGHLGLIVASNPA